MGVGVANSAALSYTELQLSRKKQTRPTADQNQFLGLLVGPWLSRCRPRLLELLGSKGWGDVNSNQTPKIKGSLCTSHQCISRFGATQQVACSVHTVSQSGDLHAAGTPVTFVC